MNGNVVLDTNAAVSSVVGEILSPSRKNIGMSSTRTSRKPLGPSDIPPAHGITTRTSILKTITSANLPTASSKPPGPSDIRSSLGIIHDASDRSDAHRNKPFSDILVASAQKKRTVSGMKYDQVSEKYFKENNSRVNDLISFLCFNSRLRIYRFLRVSDSHRQKRSGYG